MHISRKGLDYQHFFLTRSFNYLIAGWLEIFRQGWQAWKDSQHEIKQAGEGYWYLVTLKNPGNKKRYQNTARLCSVCKTWKVKIALQVKGIFTHPVTLLRYDG